MANMAVLNTIYNHYLTSYAPKSTTQYDTHKKSELRNIYNSIVKQNKESPLCIIDTSKESQEYAVGIKENARELRNTIASLGGLDENEVLGKKIAYSTNENIVTADYIGENDDAEVPAFEITVEKLANPQVNSGRYLDAQNSVDMSADVYSFDIKVSDMNYEFQFNVKPDDTNKNLQTKLANLVNNSDIGLYASVLDDSHGNSSLQIQSVNTGLPEGKENLFTISDEHTSKKTGIVDYLGLGEITKNAGNALFHLNGTERSALSNHFTVEKTYELNLTGVSASEDDVAKVGIKADTESLKENIVQLVGSYNDFVKSASSYLEKQPESSRLVNEMSRITRYYHNGLSNMGLNVENDGTIAVDEDMINTLAEEGNTDFLAPVKDFTNTVLRKANQVSLNPMNYVNKTIVAYKNPGHNFASPYVTSAYSGMMFNSYC